MSYGCIHPAALNSSLHCPLYWPQILQSTFTVCTTALQLYSALCVCVCVHWCMPCFVLTCHCRRQLRRLLRLRPQAERSDRRRRRQQQQGSLPRDAHTGTHTRTIELTHMDVRKETPGLRCKQRWNILTFYSKEHLIFMTSLQNGPYLVNSEEILQILQDDDCIFSVILEAKF